jgi:hypothetical protein
MNRFPCIDCTELVNSRRNAWQNESKFKDETLVLRKKQDLLWTEILYVTLASIVGATCHAVSRIEAKSRLFLIRQYSGTSGEAVRDSRIVVADQGDALSAIKP